MSALGRIAARWLPAPMVRRLRRAYRRTAFPEGYFRSLTLDQHDIETGAYESYLYGGPDAWRGHGAFQLHFLRTMGLRPSHRLLDVGCGPLRGGIHAIRYLDRGAYCGVDFNPSFVRAAVERVRVDGLVDKAPVLRVIDDLAVDAVEGAFDFVLAFSLLNHCDAEQRRHFFARIPERLECAGRLYVTHADWCDDATTFGPRLELRRTFASAADVAPDLRMADWAWPEKRPPVFPILEIGRVP